MKLRDWINAQKITVRDKSGNPCRVWGMGGPKILKRGMRMKDFAALIDVHPTTASNLVNGKQVPSKNTMAKIYKATNGEVTPDDMFGGVE